MTTAIDTNVIVGLWDADRTIALPARRALDLAFRRGNLVVAAPVFAELIAAPRRNEDFVAAFLEDTGIAVDWDLTEAIWRSAGRAFRGYAQRRRRQGNAGGLRILADFLIGAHADEHGYRLLTLDERLFRAAFPSPKLLTV